MTELSSLKNIGKEIERKLKSIGINSAEELKDFIYESNNGKDIFFVENEDAAIKMLSK